MTDASPSFLEFGDFRIDPRKRTLARIGGEMIALTPKHFDTLHYLVEHAGEVLEKGALMSAIWLGVIVEENNLSQAISQLRRLLGDNGGEHRYILTAPRRGYRFVADVRAQGEAPATPPDMANTEKPIEPSVTQPLRATVLEPTGRLDEALDAQRRAVSLDPRNSAMAHRLAFLLIYQRRYDEALKQARVNLELDPKYLNNHVVIARAHEAKGEFREALAAYRIPKWTFLPEEAIADIEAALAKSGADGYWRARRAWQARYAAVQLEGLYFSAAMSAQVGEFAAALRDVNRAIDLRNPFLIFSKIDPLFDPLRKDPRFATSLARLNLN